MINCEQWYGADPDLLTDAEIKLEIPKTTKAQIIVYGAKRWDHFRKFLRETSGRVQTALQETGLEYKIIPYQKAMPEEDENSSEFLFRNIQKLGVPANLMAIINPPLKYEPINPSEYPHHFLSTGIYTGSKVIDSEVKIKQIKLDKTNVTKNIRVVPVFDKWDVGFGIGFNFENQWFFSIGLENPKFEQEYSNLAKHIKRCEGISMLQERVETYTIPKTDFTTTFSILE